MANNHATLEILALIEKHFDRTYYLRTYSDVGHSGMDPIDHYKTYGWQEGRAPVPWFDPVAYSRRYPGMVEDGDDPFAHFLANGDVEGAKNAFLKAGSPETDHPMRKLFSGQRRLTDETDIYMIRQPSREELQAARPHFDETYYLSSNPDVADSLVDPLTHFLTVGWVEGRDPSPDFSVRFYLRNNSDVRNSKLNPFLHYCKHGIREKWRKSAGVEEAIVLSKFETSEKLQTLVKEAIALEPMVALPDVHRSVNIPRRSRSEITAAARALREALGGRSYRHVILVPQVRMSGAAKVASVYAKTLAALLKGERVLVVLTDGSDSEYRHWFPDSCDFYDASPVFQAVVAGEREQLLYDLLRGAGAEAFHNVNSYLAWAAMEAFGRQLHQEFRVFTYLFTWDESVRGSRVGYPIQWLRKTCDHHHVIMTDSEALADDIRARFGYGVTGGTEVLALHTPGSDNGLEALVRKVNTPKAPVFLWAGRFDRQKRTDILIGIAKANPQAVFHVYGKTVLDSAGLNQEDLPGNCLLKGHYQSLEEVFEAGSYAGFVYTSQWDGIPTILVDMASAGLPIIAPAVGGIPELINETTGYLIPEFDDVQAYSQAILQISEEPEDALSRAAALKEHLKVEFNEAKYAKKIKEALKRNDL